MNNWNQTGFDHYRSAPNGGIIWVSPDDDRPEGYSIILNKDGETKELGFAEDLGDAKDIADRECRAMESVGSLKGCTLSGDWVDGKEYEIKDGYYLTAWDGVKDRDGNEVPFGKAVELVENNPRLKSFLSGLCESDCIDEYATIPKETYESMRERIQPTQEDVLSQISDYIEDEFILENKDVLLKAIENSIKDEPKRPSALDYLCHVDYCEQDLAYVLTFKSEDREVKAALWTKYTNVNLTSEFANLLFASPFCTDGVFEDKNIGETKYLIIYESTTHHPLGKTIANLKTAIKDAEEENTGDDWEDSTIKTWDEK